jgi:hypothetical protein
MDSNTKELINTAQRLGMEKLIGKVMDGLNKWEYKNLSVSEVISILERGLEEASTDLVLDNICS